MIHKRTLFWWLYVQWQHQFIFLSFLRLNIHLLQEVVFQQIMVFLGRDSLRLGPLNSVNFLTGKELDSLTVYTSLDFFKSQLMLFFLIKVNHLDLFFKIDNVSYKWSNFIMGSIQNYEVNGKRKIGLNLNQHVVNAISRKQSLEIIRIEDVQLMLTLFGYKTDMLVQMKK